MSDLRWPVSALEIRLQDPDPQVQAWAARWLKEYHGRAGEEALRRFVEAHRNKVNLLTPGAQQPKGAAPAPAQGKGVLLDAGTPKEPQADLRSFLAQALADPRNVLTPDFLALCPPVSLLPTILASIHKGTEATGDWQHVADQALLVGGAAIDLMRLGELANAKRTLDAFLADLLRDLGSVPAGVQAVVTRHIVEKKGTLDELTASMAPTWPSGGGEELAAPSAPPAARVRAQLAWRIAAARLLAEDLARWPFPKETVTSAACMVLSLLLAAHRSRALLDRASDEASPAALADLASAAYPWVDASVFEWASKGWDPAALAAEVMARLEKTDDPTRRSNLLHLFAQAKHAKSAAALVAVLAKKGTTGMEAAALSAIAAVAPEARAALREHLATGHPTLAFLALQLSMEEPTAESEEFLLETWDRIAEKFPVWAPLCTAAELFASPKFLPKLLDLWRPGEDRIETSIAFLSKWTPEPSPPVRLLVEHSRARAAREERRRVENERGEADIQELLDAHPLVPLTCAVCGATYSYDVGLCFMPVMQSAQTKKSRIELHGFQHVVQCKHCLARDQYALPEEGQVLLRLRQQYAFALLEQKTRYEEIVARTGCVFDTPRLSDGTEVGSMTQATQIALGRLRTHPKEFATWFQLGNLYEHGGLFADAREAFETALGIEPGRVEALFPLANIDLLEWRGARAAERYREVVRRLLAEKVPPERGLPFFHGCILGLLQVEKDHGIAPQLDLGGEKVDLASAAARERAYCRLVGAPPPARKTERVAEHAPKDAPQTITGSNVIGRNDPCPCGSGRKYKKCCGKETT